MRYLIRHPDAQPKLERSTQKDGRLLDKICYEIGSGYSSRYPQEAAWIEARRQYGALPRTPVRNQPIPNSPNIEFPIGALIADSLYAQVTDTLYQAQPILTCREMDEEWEDNSRAMQKFVTWMAANEIGLRFCTDTSFQDDIQLGTGVIYCPWVDEEKNTTIHKIVSSEPRLIPISPEDFLVPGGSRGDHQQDEWCSIRFWYTKGEYLSQLRAQQWENLGKPIAAQDQVRMYHEQVGRTTSVNAYRERYAIENVHIYHDYEGDGIDRDLMVAYDHNAKALLKVEYNRYDTRPIETMRYQVRPHLFWGLGVMEMTQPFEESASDIINHYLLNMMLCNGRMYMARHGTIDDFKRVWPMRIVGVESTEDIKELRLSDVYPSALQGLQQVIQTAERRVGVTGDFTSGNPASRVLGTRTPGITAMSALQSVNRRFAPAFDGMRLNAAAAVRQCVWRYAERVRSGDLRVTKHLTDLLGDADAQLVLEVLRQPNFERAVAIEFTAVSASVNREADRQNAMLVMDKLGAYHQQIIGAMMQMAQPNVPPEVHDVVKTSLKAVNYAMEGFLQTFDQVRNPKRLLVDISPQIDQAQAKAVQAEQTQGIAGSLLSALGGGGTGGGPPPEGGVPPVA